MAAGSIIIDLLMNTGSFETDTNRAAKSLQKAMNDAVASVKGLAAAFGVGIGVDAFKDLIAGSIEASAHLDDLSKKTGIAADVLGGIGFAAKQAGGDLDSAVAGANRLNKSLAEAAAGTPEAAEAFRVLGVNVKDASGNVKTADVALAELADKFASYADGPNKTALAIRIFGKAGADMIPVLDEGGAKLRENIAFFQQYSGVTNETAHASQQFQETLAHLSLIQGAFGQQLASDFLPTLQSIADAFLDLKKNSDLAQNAASGLGDLFKGLTVGLAGFLFVVVQTAKGIGAIAAASGDIQTAFDALKFGQLGAAKDAFDKALVPLKEFSGDLDEAAMKAAAFQAKILSAGKAAAQTPAEFFQSSAAANLNRTSAKPEAPGLAAKGSLDTFDALMKQAQGLNAAAVAGIAAADSLQVLNDADKESAKLTDEYAAGTLKITAAQLAQVQAILKLASAHENELANIKLDQKLTAEAVAENDSYIVQQQTLLEGFRKQADTQMQLADQYGISADEIKRLTDEGQGNTALALQQIALYGKTADALDALQVAHLKDELAALQWKAANTPDGDAKTKIEQETAALNDRINALVRTQTAQKQAASGFADYFSQYVSQANSAATAAHDFSQTTVGGLEDTLTTLLSTGKADFHSLMTAIIAEFDRLYIVKPLLANIFGTSGSNGSLGGMLGVLGDLLGIGGSSGGASFASLAGISGGRASGGSVGAGQTYLVGERGPELLHMGSSGGSITPNGAGRSIVVNVQGTPGMSRDTAMQQGAAIGAGIQRSLARNA